MAVHFAQMNIDINVEHIVAKNVEMTGNNVNIENVETCEKNGQSSVFASTSATPTFAVVAATTAAIIAASTVAPLPRFYPCSYIRS